jgi:iron complex outermembrane receptor protein
MNQGGRKEMVSGNALALALGWLLVGPAGIVAVAPHAAWGAEAPVTRSYAIPAGTLADALARFAAAAGVPLSFDPRMLDGLNSPGLRGEFGVSEGFTRLLAGSGYQIVDMGDSRYTLRAAGGGAMTLSPVTVSADGQPRNETATGPVDGYVAKRALTATKTDTPIKETPQSISVVTRDQMDDQGAQTVGQALRYTAGVYSDGRAGSRYDSVFMRGFGGYGSTAGYVEYLDGLRMLRGISYAIPTLDENELERVEVLRGPSSVLYGQANPGGIVNMTSKRPTTEPYHEVTMGFGTNDTYYSTYDMGGPVTDDKTVSYRLTGSGRTESADTDHNKSQRIAVAPSFTWQPNADTSLTLLTNYQYDPKSYYAPYLPAYGTVWPNAAVGKISKSFDPGDPNYNSYERTQGSVGYQFEHHIDDKLTVRQNLRYLHVDSTFHAVSLASLSANQATLNRRATVSNENVNTVVVDNQGEVKFETGPVAHTLLTGLDYQWVYANRELGTATTSSLSLTDPVYYRSISSPAITSRTSQLQKQVGVYSQDQMRVGRWALLMGVREDDASVDTDVKLGGTSSSLNKSAFTWRSGLVYLFDNGLAPYASYSTSFQPQTGTTYTGQALDPSEGKQYEVGIRYQPDGMKSSMTVSGYDLTQSNVSVSDTAHTGFYTQTGEITSRGAEVEIKTSVTDNLNVIANYGYTNVVNTKTSDPTALGKHPVGAPKHIASLWGNYEFDRGELAGFGLGGGIRFVGSTAGSTDNSLQVSAYRLYDAMAYYDLKNINPVLEGARLQLNGTNLTNKTYVSGCGSTTTCFYGEGRTIIGSLRYRW